jgi:hypothetical protein
MPPAMNYYVVCWQDEVSMHLPKHAPDLLGEAGNCASALLGWMRKGRPAHDANRT